MTQVAELRPSVRSALPGFVGLSFALAWSLWGASSTIPASGPASILRQLVFLGGVFSPGIAAIILTWRTEGKASAKYLVLHAFRFPSNSAWYVFAAGYIVVVRLVAASIDRAITGAWPEFGETRVLLIGLGIAISTWVQLGEELGWRAFALPRLAAHIGWRLASIALGILWAAWHLPRFFAQSSDVYQHSFIEFLLQVTALSCTIAWLYLRTDSLVLVMLMHAAVNNTTGLVRADGPHPGNPFGVSHSLFSWTMTGLLWLGAAVCLHLLPSADHTRPTCGRML